MKAMKNIKTFSWWNANIESANDFSDSKIGEVMSVCITDVFPSLQMCSHPAGCEFENAHLSSSMTDGPIEVMVDSNDGYLVIRDGHHRFSDAIKAGDKYVKVVVVGFEPAYKAPFTAFKKTL